jgi:hypothetical protein
MNIYEKIAEARIRFQKKNVKKTGKNDYAGYTYFTLDEILPAINSIANELKFLTIFDTTENSATLTIVDSEKPEDKVKFSCAYVRTTMKAVTKDGKEITDIQAALLKGCHPVQNEGAAITYLKRYLYLNAFEISEADVLDKTMNPNEGAPKPKKKPFVDVIAEFPKDKVSNALGHFGYEKVEDIPKENQAEFYNMLKEM